LKIDSEGPMMFTFGGDEEDGEGNGKPMGLMIGPDKAGDMPDINPDDFDFDGDMPAGANVGVAVRVTAPGSGPDDADGEPMFAPGQGGATAVAGGEDGQPQVSIKMAGANGQDLPPEVRAKLEKRAAEMAEKIKAQIEKRMAENQNAGDAADGALTAALP